MVTEFRRCPRSRASTLHPCEGCSDNNDSLGRGLPGFIAILDRPRRFGGVANGTTAPDVLVIQAKVRGKKLSKEPGFADFDEHGDRQAKAMLWCSCYVERRDKEDEPRKPSYSWPRAGRSCGEIFDVPGGSRPRGLGSANLECEYRAPK